MSIDEQIAINRANLEGAYNRALEYLNKQSDLAMEQGNKHEVYYFMRQLDQLETHVRKVMQRIG
jgi:hypothetical protein